MNTTTRHPCAIYVGNARRPNQWQAAITSDGMPGTNGTVHWRGEIHRTFLDAQREAEAKVEGGA